METCQVFPPKYLSEKLYKDGSILEMVVWKLPIANQERLHALKYRLWIGRDGTCQVRYDNEQGKGDHRHYGEKEESYSFTDIETLIEDFLNDVSRYRENMTQKIQIALGTASDAAQDIIAAWHCAEHNETYTGTTEKLYFEDLETLLKVLTQRRWQLLKTLRLAGPTDTLSLSKMLNWNDREIQTDINELEQSGLILRTPIDQVVAPWDVIEAQMRLAA